MIKDTTSSNKHTENDFIKEKSEENKKNLSLLYRGNNKALISDAEELKQKESNMIILQNKESFNQHKIDRNSLKFSNLKVYLAILLRM